MVEVREAFRVALGKDIRKGWEEADFELLF